MTTKWLYVVGHIDSIPVKKNKILIKRFIHSVGRSMCNGIQQEVFSGLLVRKTNMLVAGFVRAAVSEGYLALQWTCQPTLQ